MVTHLRGLLEKEIRERFPVPEGQRTYPGGQRAIADAMHVSQPLLNQFLKGKKDVGLDVLLGIRAYFIETGRPMTLDELLGLKDAREQAEGGAMIDRLAHLEAQVQALVAAGPRVPGAKRVRQEVERARLTAVGTREAQRKAREGAAYSKKSTAEPAKKVG